MDKVNIIKCGFCYENPAFAWGVSSFDLGAHGSSFECDFCATTAKVTKDGEDGGGNQCHILDIGTEQEAEQSFALGAWYSEYAKELFDGDPSWEINDDSYVVIKCRDLYVGRSCNPQQDADSFEIFYSLEEATKFAENEFNQQVEINKEREEEDSRMEEREGY